MDYHAFASLAHVRILLVPVGSIRRATFDKWATEIRNFDNLRLGDIPADSKDERARFMPNPLASGHLHLNFPTHPPPSTHSSMALFRPSHHPLGVIGIASCSQTDSLSGILAEFNAVVGGLFPRDALFPLASNCFVFEDDDGSTNLNLGDNLPGLVVIPSMMGNKKIYIGTLLADLCSQILGEFATVVNRLESPLGNEYLNSSLFPVLPPASELPEVLDHIDETKRASLPSHNSQPELSASNGTMLAKRPGLSLKRTSTMGPGVSPMTPGFRSASLTVQPPAKKRHSGIGAASSHGRLFKTLGDFFLLAGRIEDASVWYNEAIVLFKTSPDPIWYASALEGLVTVTVLEAWSAGHGLHTSFSSGKEPWTDISDKLNQAVNLYSRPSVLEIESNAPLIAYLYTCSVLRHTHFLFAVWSAKGWGPLAFTTMLQPGSSYYLPPTLSHIDSTSYVNLERLTSITHISRVQIATVLCQAHGPWLLHLGPRERVAALEVAAGMYGCIGYKRKEAYILREVLGCLMDLIVCAREESQEHRASRPQSAGAGLGFNGVNLGSHKQVVDQGTVGVRENESKDGNESILRLVKHICRVHGVNLNAVKLVDISTDVEGNVRDSVQSSSVLEEEIVEGQPETHGWPELQVGIIREAMAVAEALPGTDYPAVAQFALSALKTLHPVLASSEQHHLYSTASQALATSKRRGDRRQVEYWSGQPIVSIELSPLPLARLPLEKPLSVLEKRLSENAAVLPGVTDPFLYNPRKSLSGKTLFTVARNENLEIVVTIRNPFVFDMELQKVALSTSGVPFQGKDISLTVPANSFHPVTLTGKPTKVGMLVIRGCIVQAPGGAPREFILPLSTDEEEERRLRRRSAIDCEVGRTKYSGLMALPWEKPLKRTSGSGPKATTSNRAPPPPHFLECRIIPDQPLLRIRRISVTHGAVMMYNGETSTIRLTLENVSSIPVDFVRLTFEDSTIAPAQQALAEGELSVFEMYETEYDLLHRPVFSWSDHKYVKEIAPGAKTVLTVSCFGKVGCSSGAIHVAYANLNRPRDSLDTPPQVFYTRQLSYPLLVTVYHMLECQAMDISPYEALEPSELSAIHKSNDLSKIQSLLNIEDTIGWCLFSVDVRNTYGLPFEVTFDREQEGAPRESVTSLVPPGSTTRIVIPLKKFSLPAEQISQPIPTLSDRQFVIDKARLSNEEQTMQRELFWYREEVLQCIRGRWREAGGTRSGELSLRKQRMTLPMLQAVRTETARVQMSLLSLNTSNSGISHQGRIYLPEANEFLYLRTSVTNLSDAPLSLTLDLAMDPAEHVIHEGILNAIPIGLLRPNGSHDVDIVVCFVCGGTFNITATVRTLAALPSAGKVGFGDLTVLARCES
ncbi:hypothetical protein NEOLEDRAFT_1062821 [Neolentinus lepideus HHB14362 ss-1]|uniref:Uncharacterized protein n=1 Tax=Neolentinus lepideus HHB14362 ss-1 TaxID=1314782 RepID=A0A165TBW3_9AGAM|nr:hypothetical protein NEOLEDRAFT_1062821 [Neolentinus lepideus HHB14362 ss-1]